MIILYISTVDRLKSRCSPYLRVSRFADRRDSCRYARCSRSCNWAYRRSDIGYRPMHLDLKLYGHRVFQRPTVALNFFDESVYHTPTQSPSTIISPALRYGAQYDTIMLYTSIKWRFDANDTCLLGVEFDWALDLVLDRLPSVVSRIPRITLVLDFSLRFQSMFTVVYMHFYHKLQIGIPNPEPRATNVHSGTATY